MKPTIPRGTRDFGPVEMQKRLFILNIIRKNFELFGFQAIETPAMENLETLTGKYGDEGDQLIFKVLNSGNYFSEFKTDTQFLDTKKKGESYFTRFISGKALRYDLTVPFARYVATNQYLLAYPFKRYQLQPVWRADKPQKGRYREFYQCDADVIGSDSLTNELELISLVDKVFSELNAGIKLKINNRKILTGIAEKINALDKIVDITVAIDKIDKIGLEGVNKELIAKGISQESVDSLQELFNNKGDAKQTTEFLKKFLQGIETGNKGIAELEYLFNNISKLNLSSKTSVELDLTLARGLNYYTGTIFEVKPAAGTSASSILGGGRYDDLTGIFDVPKMSGVGISFGVDRIYDMMEELQLFPAEVAKVSVTRVLFTHFDEASRDFCLKPAKELRDDGISCEVFPDLIKINKQFDYANKKNIPFVCTVGSDEMSSGKLSFKDMNKRVQMQLSFPEIVSYLKEH